MCDVVRYVPFTTNLNLLRKTKTTSTLLRSLMTTLVALILLLLFGLLSPDSPEHHLHLIFVLPKFDYGIMFRKTLKCHKYFLKIYIAIVSIYIFYLATTPIESILCLLVFQMWCNAFTQNGSQWVQILLIILSNDVRQNPGPPFHNSFFSFMSWNVNSIAKDDFQRVHLIEAHNSIFNYDLISICETSLNDSIKLPDILLNDYTFVPSKKPTNSRQTQISDLDFEETSQHFKFHLRDSKKCQSKS